MSLQCGEAVAQQLLDFGPYQGFALGKGILGSDYSNPLPSCIHGSQNLLPSSGADVRVSIVFNQDQYSSAFHIDQKAQASFLGLGGGSESFSLGKSEQSATTGFNVVVEAYSEDAGQTLDNINWDPPYDEMMRSGDPMKTQQVRQICGDRFIDSVFNERRLFAVLHVSKSATASTFSMAASGGAHVGISVLSASGSLGGDINISKAHKAGQITVDIYSEGLGGLAPTADAVKIAQSDSLSDVASRLADYLAKLQAKNPAPQPIKYRLTALPGMATGDLEGDVIASDLRKMKDEYVLASTRLSNVQLLLGSDLRRSLLRQPSGDNQLRTQEIALTSYRDEVATTHEQCRQAFRLSICAEALKSLPLPPLRSAVELDSNSDFENQAGAFVNPWLPAFLPPSPALNEPFSGKIIADSAVLSDVLDRQLVTTAGATSMLDAARTIDPATRSIDAALALPSAYISSLDFLMAPPAHSLATQGTRRLLSQDFGSLPAGAKATLVSLWHADSTTPCAALAFDGIVYPDSSCLRPLGEIVKEQALLLAAGNAMKVATFPAAAPILGPLGAAYPTFVWSKIALDIR
jgi:hypothetical protein